MEARRLRPWLALAMVVSAPLGGRAQIFVPAPLPMQRAPQGFVGAPPVGMVRAVPVSAAQRGPAQARGQAAANSENFIVFANDPQWARQVAQVAEQHRRELAIHWLGQELPAWPQRCPIHVQDAENLGAGGETRFALSRGVPGNWMMSVQGTRERILDSVLPHEITHTIFATHFGRLNKYVPRWADEGACTTVEHEAEKGKHRHFLQQFLKTGRGLAFNEMFRLKEYPQDILPLYAQGHSAVQFLLDQAGPREFIRFLELGMQTENWPAALQKHYAYTSIGDFQVHWNQWLIDGSPADLMAYAPLLRRQQVGDVMLASSTGSASPQPQPEAAPASPTEALRSRRDETMPTREDSPAAASLVAIADSPVEPPQGAAITLDEAIAMASRSPAESLAAGRSAVKDLGSDSWYKRQLHLASGSPATPIPPHNHFSGDAGEPHGAVRAANGPALADPAEDSSHGRQGNSVARPQPMQSPAIQVLDWGHSAPQAGPDQYHRYPAIIR